MLDVKARLQEDLGQPALAIATFRQAEEFFVAAERKGLVNAHGHEIRKTMLYSTAEAYLTAHQLEPAKRYYLRALAMPDLGVLGRKAVLLGMAR